MLHWVAGRFGRPAGLHTDVGGGFSNAEVTEMTERLECRVTSVAGDSPYMNGLNEKNHHTVDRMYNMKEEDNPDLKPEGILAHALHAKNYCRWFMDLVHISWFLANCLTFQVLLMLLLQ